MWAIGSAMVVRWGEVTGTMSALGKEFVGGDWRGKGWKASDWADGSITPIDIAKGRKKDENSPRSGKRNRECYAHCESKREMLRWDP